MGKAYRAKQKTGLWFATYVALGKPFSDSGNSLWVAFAFQIWGESMILLWLGRSLVLISKAMELNTILKAMHFY